VSPRRSSSVPPCLAAEVIEDLARAQQDEASVRPMAGPSGPDRRPARRSSFRPRVEQLLYHGFAFTMAAFTLIAVDLSRDFKVSWSAIVIAAWAVLLAAHICVFVLAPKLRRPERVTFGSRPRLRRSD